MTAYDVVSVDLPGRAYEVRIGQGLLSDAGAQIAPLLGRPRVAIVADAQVDALHGADMRDALHAAGIANATLVVPPGEATKNWARLEEVCGWLLSEKIERSDVVVAMGGGVIGDLVGFAAAIVRRGLRYVQIPTSLLAQVDSSVGGKTAINTAHGKNLIGAFHQPSLVLADIGVLDSLPPRDFRAGYGEVAKYGLLGDAAFFGWLEQNAHALMAGDVEARRHAVRRSVQMKAEIVTRDETEQGDRALLNLGHTFCHALEAATGYAGRLLHGEGVAIGCALAFDLSARLGLCSQELPSRVRAHLHALGIASDINQIPGAPLDPAEVVALMAQDKKVVAGQLRFILARDIGAAFVARDVPTQAVLDVVAQSAAPRS